MIEIMIGVLVFGFFVALVAILDSYGKKQRRDALNAEWEDK